MKWYKRDPEAFKGGTLGLTLEEIGAYTLLLDDIYARDGNVPDNIDYLHRLWRCDIRVAKRLRDRLIFTEKIKQIGKLLTNLRATCELSEQHVKSYLQAKNQQNQQNGPTHLQPEYREAKQMDFRDKGVEYRSPPRSKSDNILQLLPERR
jgi:uncharacterized protein YdaU (DUF1376 family)